MKVGIVPVVTVWKVGNWVVPLPLPLFRSHWQSREFNDSLSVSAKIQSIPFYRCYRRRGRSYHWILIPNCKGIYFVANTIGCAWREFNCDLRNFLLTIYIVDSGCLVKLTTHIFLLGMNAPPPTSSYTLHKLMHSFFPSRLQIPVASHRRFPSLVPLSRTYKLSSFSALLRLSQHSEQTADCFWTVEQPQWPQWPRSLYYD